MLMYGPTQRRVGWIGWALLLAVAAMVVLVLPSYGASEPAQSGPGVNPVAGELPTIAQMFQFSPVINGIIACLSVLAVGLFLFFLMTISTTGMAPPSFVDAVTKMVISREYEDATRFCRNHSDVFAASIVQRCVENAGKPHSLIMDMIDVEGRRRADIVWNRVSALADLSNLAPMLGLLGTVRGMLKAFFSLKGETGTINSMALAGSIGEAMTTTLFGLALAILTLIFYTIVKARLTRALAMVEQMVHSIADHIKREEIGDGSTR